MFKRVFGLGVAIIVGALLVSASGAATTKTQKVTKIDVSTRAAVVHYLRSIHVNAKHVVVQRGLRNYAGAHCPGKGWTCAGTRHTVVQIAKRGGLNRFACTTAKCAVVQLAGAHRARLRAAPKPPPPPNTALCAKTTGVTQSCVINQPNASGTNQALVWMVTPKNTGLTQSSSYTATITQGPASATGSSNANIACVRQFVWLDGSTTKTNTAGTTITNDNHELITINQNSLTGNNTVQGAKTTGTNAYACDASQPLMQDELLTSVVNSKGSITQNQDTLPSTTSCTKPPDASGCANVVTDIEQNQGVGFKGFASGLNNASFEQSTKQVAIANTPRGTVKQTQGANVPAPPYSGIVGTINQDSTAKSAAVVDQNETQCQDAVNVSTPIPAPTAATGLGSVVCPAAGGVPSGVTLTQTQYGPEGVGVLAPSTNNAGRVHYYHKGYGQSQQTNAGAGVFDSFKLTQHSTQIQDEPGPNVTLTQVNTMQGDCISSGDASDFGGACEAFQQATLNGVTNGTTTDGYTAGGIGGTSSNPPLVISCTNGHSTCQPTPPPTPVITPPTPSDPSESTSATFTWTDDATAGVTFECSTDGGTTFNSCSSGDTFNNLPLGPNTFEVRAVDVGNNPSDADSFTWTIVPYLTFEATSDGASAGWTGGVPGPDPSITLVVGSDSPNTFGQFTLHNFEGIAIGDLGEPSFTTDAYSGGVPREEIDFSNGDYVFGYPSQAGFGADSWQLVCDGGCVGDDGFMSWGDVQTVEGNLDATVAAALVEADGGVPEGSTYVISDFTFDGYDLSDFTYHWHNG